VLKYIPQNGKITECEWNDFYHNGTNIDYNSFVDDPVIQIKYNSNFEEPLCERWDSYCMYKSKDFILNESEEWNNPNTIEKVILYFEGKEFEYTITKGFDDDGDYYGMVKLFEKDEDGDWYEQRYYISKEVLNILYS
jgi:hypothetical protein